MALRVAAGISNLVEVPGFLCHDDSKVCAQLLEILEELQVKVPRSLGFVAPQEVSSRMLLESPHRNAKPRFKSLWREFNQDLLAFLKQDRAGGMSMRAMSRALAEKPDNLLAHVVHAVIGSADKEAGLNDDVFCLSWLSAVRGSLYLAISSASNVDANWNNFLRSHPIPSMSATRATWCRAGRRFLYAGALRMSLILVKHTNDDIVMGAIQLTSQILRACPTEAQDAAVAIFKEEGAEQIFLCLQACLRRFSGPAEQNRSSCRSAADAVPVSGRYMSTNGIAGANVGIGACELIEMLERLCQVAL